MPKEKKTLLDFWEDQMRQSHTASNYFFRKSPSHYHMMLLVMSAHKENKKLSVEELKTKLFKTSRPKSALIITEACEKGFFRLEKTSADQRIKNIMPSESFIKEFNDYLVTLKNISYYPFLNENLSIYFLYIIFSSIKNYINCPCQKIMFYYDDITFESKSSYHRWWNSRS